MKKRNPIPKLKKFWDDEGTSPLRARFIDQVFDGKYTTAYHAVHGLRSYQPQAAHSTVEFFTANGLDISLTDIRPDIWRPDKQRVA